MPDASLTARIRSRFGDSTGIPLAMESSPVLAGMAGRASCRAFKDAPVSRDILNTLCAVALSAPSKSDLQQRDILIVSDKAVAGRLRKLLAAQAWIAGAPALVVFLANNRRQRQLHYWRSRDFANDHLDAFFNATVDAAIALGFFVVAAEAAGLGCCPISTIRNHCDEASRLLNLPDHVFPVAAGAVGQPDDKPRSISPRLPLSGTVHIDTFADMSEEDFAAYDRRRNEMHPYRSQRSVAQFEVSDEYTWSEDKVRQYSLPEREDFGDFIRRKGFKLD